MNGRRRLRIKKQIRTTKEAQVEENVLQKIQSSIESIITVNFENVGKKVINIDEIDLRIIEIK